MLSILFRNRKEEENDTLHLNSVIVQAIQSVEADLREEETAPRVVESITERHRGAIERGIKNVQQRLALNHEEMGRLTEEYNRVMAKIRSDNDEYELSLRAMSASIAIFDEHNDKNPDLLDRALLREGRTIKSLEQMWDQSVKDRVEDPYAAFADQLGWSRDDAKMLAYRIAYNGDADNASHS